MTDNIKEAGAKTVQETPDQVQEAQLERSDLYHARQKDDKHSVTQKQLESQRKGEKDYITEKQLDDSELKLHGRDDNPPDQVQEAQLAEGDNRLDDEKHSITQQQLDDAGQRVDNEPEVITEKQLDNVDGPWARFAKRDPSKFKSASQHMASAIDVMADTVVKSGCTPDEIIEVATSLVDSSKSRYNLVTSLVEDSKPREDVDYAKRVAYWQNKNLKFASVSTKEVASMIVDGLRVYASDTTYNPDVLIDAIDVLTEGEDGINSISTAVEKKLTAKKEETKSKGRKAELRAALAPEKKPVTAEKRQIRDAERKALLDDLANDEPKILNEAGIKDADTIIQASFEEIGVKPEEANTPAFKAAYEYFAKGAMAAQNLRYASITNVTISGDTIQIAVQTDTEENEVNIDTGDGTTEIPIGGEEPTAPAPAETLPEGDMAGEGLENNMSQGAWAASGKKMQKTASSKVKKEAQSPMGGGIPGTPGGVAAPGSPEQGLPGPTPETDPVQALTTGDEGAEDEIPTSGKRQMPWTICPECGSSDVDVTNKSGDIEGHCNACTADYEALIKKSVEFRIIKPTKSVGEEGAEEPQAPEAPEVPALPVAAQTKIDKNTLVRIASNREKHGHVCPACGQKKCEAAKDEKGHVEFKCKTCGTEVEKDVMVSVKNPDVSYLRVAWEVFPDVENCKGCKEAAAKFASEVKMTKMLKEAAAKSGEFPMSNCVERVARQYGGATVATFGPCKGKLLADCVCKELQKLGFRKVRHMNKFASISVEKDPWDECIEDQTKHEGHSLKEAESICGCIKKKFASEAMTNIYVQAFGEDVESGVEKDITSQDLLTINELLKAEKKAAIEAEQRKQVQAEEADLGSELPPMESIEIEAEVVKEQKVVEAKKSVKCKGCGKDSKECDCPKDGGDDKGEKKEKKASVEEKKDAPAKETKTVEASAPKAPEAKVEEVKEQVNPEEEKRQALALDGKRVRKSNEEVLKMASTPKKVETIEGNVEAGVPRSNATIRNEGKDNIDVPMAKPSVPRGNAEMGNESAENINPKADGPDVPVDSAYMGHEKEVQKGYDHANRAGGMPEINNEIKGTVIAQVADDLATKLAATTNISKEAVLAFLQKEAKKLKEVDSVEGDVEAGVPRSNATIGNEGKDNIDVPMAKPSVPRGNAEMGNESSENINPKADGPDVPMGDAYMGHEKEVQKGYDHANRSGGMPENNEEYLKQVKQKRQVQLDRIAQARKNEAVQTTAWLVANNRIASDKDTFDTVVNALMGFEADQISTTAQKMFPAKEIKVASAQSKKTVEAGYSGPAIILEPKPMGGESDDLQNKLSNAFTIGNSKFDKDLTLYGVK